MESTEQLSSVERGHVVGSIVDALGQVLNRDLSGTAQSTRLFDELSLDSTNVLELLMVLEDVLGVQFDADTLEQHHFVSVGSLADYVIDQLDG